VTFLQVEGRTFCLNAVYRRNLESCKAKYGNLLKEFMNTDAIYHRNLENCNAK